MPSSTGPTHKYIGALPGCWSIYGDVLGREYGEYRYPEVHRLTVDVYAAQHPGEPSARSIQSVAVHLIALHCTFERAMASREITVFMHAALQVRDRFVWLNPPSFERSINVIEIAAAADLPAHEEVVKRWAADVWRCWTPHHETVRQWAQAARKR